MFTEIRLFFAKQTTIDVNEKRFRETIFTLQIFKKVIDLEFIQQKLDRKAG